MPADDAARRAAGMAAFHCYNSAALASLDSYLRLDAAHGMESVAVVWGGAPLPAPWVSRINVDWVSACRECMWFLDCANCSLPGACMPQSLPRLRAGRARRRRRVSGQLAGCVREQLVPRVQHSSHPHSPAACAWGCFIDPHPETWPRARAAPQQFRYAECAGRVVGPDTWLFSGCVPRDDALPAFADFAAFLAGRRAPAVVAADGAAADGAALVDGRLTHFIVWNEARAQSSSTVPQQHLELLAPAAWQCASSALRP